MTSGRLYLCCGVFGGERRPSWPGTQYRLRTSYHHLVVPLQVIRVGSEYNQ